MNPDYKCIMVKVKPKRLRSKKYTVVVKGVWVEGFTRDKHGKDRPNGIRAFIPT